MTIITHAYFALAVAGLAVVAALRVKAYRLRRKAFSYCRRAADGTIYVQDPQNPGTMHKLEDLLVKRAMGGSLPEVSPRQRKRVRRRVLHAIGAR